MIRRFVVRRVEDGMFYSGKIGSWCSDFRQAKWYESPSTAQLASNTSINFWEKRDKTRLDLLEIVINQATASTFSGEKWDRTFEPTPKVKQPAYRPRPDEPVPTRMVCFDDD